MVHAVVKRLRFDGPRAAEVLSLHAREVEAVADYAARCDALVKEYPRVVCHLVFAIVTVPPDVEIGQRVRLP